MPAPRPPNVDELFPHFEQLFAEMFAKGREGAAARDVHVTLAVTPREARRGVVRDVTVGRRVACPTCSVAPYRSASGCGACKDGLVARTETLRVRVPAGVAVGAQLRLAGKGNESTTDPAGDVYAHVTVAPSMAGRLAARAGSSPWLAPRAAAWAIVLLALAAGIWASIRGR